MNLNWCSDEMPIDIALDITIPIAIKNPCNRTANTSARISTHIDQGFTMDANRFLAAQAPIFDQVPAELRLGRKTTHWMWFVFPQLAGLGHSAMARHYALQGANDARVYLHHPKLGARLILCSRIVAELPDADVQTIFGDMDAMKFHSSMTLFDHVADPAQRVFADCLQSCFGGQKDSRSVTILQNDEKNCACP
jgi:uncharacterized protein (DUF1810 family)